MPLVDARYSHSELTGRILRCAMTVHGILGSGFLEVIYQRALEVEMTLQGLQFLREHPIAICYKGVGIGKRRVDFLVEQCIMVELKAISHLEDIHLVQAINYLEAYNLQVGLLINFGSSSLQFHRISPPAKNRASRPPNHK